MKNAGIDRCRRLSLITAFIALWAMFTLGLYASARKQADRIIIVKSARTLTVMKEGKPLKTYRVALGREPVGAKTREGDGKTPEGSYKIDWRQDASLYHRALHISYPNSADRERARKLGVSPGGSIMIHGLMRKYADLGALHRTTDWTEGCIAVTNDEIDEISEIDRKSTRLNSSHT